MRSGELRLVDNSQFQSKKKLSNNTNGKKYTTVFLLLIILILGIFGGIFYFKDKLDNFKELESSLSFQKQEIMDERAFLEKTLSKEREEISLMKIDYEQKNAELTEKLNIITIKEDELNKELEQINNLKEKLKDQLVNIYDMQLDEETKIESSKVSVDNDEVINQSIHTPLEDDNEGLNEESSISKVLSTADADWLINFKGLGEFEY